MIIIVKKNRKPVTCVWQVFCLPFSFLRKWTNAGKESDILNLGGEIFLKEEATVDQHEETKEIVITNRNYEKRVIIARKIEELWQNRTAPDSERKRVFTQRDHYPTIDDMKKHKIWENLEEYLDYLIYYAEVYKTDDPNWKKNKKYILDLLTENLIIAK